MGAPVNSNMDLQFAFFNFDTTGSQTVVITHKSVITSGQVEIGIGFKEHNVVIDADGNCAPTCSLVAGKEVGIVLSDATITQSPPLCKICHKDTLFQEFYPTEDNVGGCNC